MATHPYTQANGTASGVSYFEDVALSPVTLKDGTLRARFDTLAYPQLGVTSLVTTTTVVTASSNTPVNAVPVTLSATVSAASTRGGTPTGTVTFKDGAATLGTGTLAGGVATYVVAGGFAAGSHPITAVYPGGGVLDPSTSAVRTLTVS